MSCADKRSINHGFGRKLRCTRCTSFECDARVTPSVPLLEEKSTELGHLKLEVRMEKVADALGGFYQ